MTTEKKEFNVPTWLNSILITLLVLIASASLYQNRNTQKSVDLLTIQVAVLSNQVQTHINWDENANKNNLKIMSSNEVRLDAIEKRQENFMTQREIIEQFKLIREYVEKNYLRK